MTPQEGIFRQAPVERISFGQLFMPVFEKVRSLLRNPSSCHFPIGIRGVNRPRNPFPDCQRTPFQVKDRIAFSQGNDPPHNFMPENRGRLFYPFSCISTNITAAEGHIFVFNQHFTLTERRNLTFFQLERLAGTIKNSYLTSHGSFLFFGTKFLISGV